MRNKGIRHIGINHQSKHKPRCLGVKQKVRRHGAAGDVTVADLVSRLARQRE